MIETIFWLIMLALLIVYSRICKRFFITDIDFIRCPINILPKRKLKAEWTIDVDDMQALYDEKLLKSIWENINSK